MEATRPDPPSRLHGITLVVSGVAFLLAFAPTLQFLFDRWTRSIWSNGHGLFIPAIVGYLAWDHFRRRPIVAPDSSPLGFLFLVPGLAMLAVDAAIHTQLLAAAGLVVCLPGLSLLLLGLERTRALAFPLALLPFMLPIPAAAVAWLHLLLRRVAAYASTEVVQLIGIPVVREDTTLLVPAGFIEVSDACSGFSTLYAAVTLSLILSYLTRSWRRRVAMIVGAWILAIVANAIRVSILVLLAHYGGFDLLKTSLHEISGLISFVVVLVALFALADRAELRGGAP